MTTMGRQEQAKANRGMRPAKQATDTQVRPAVNPAMHRKLYSVQQTRNIYCDYGVYVSQKPR